MPQNQCHPHQSLQLLRKRGRSGNRNSRTRWRIWRRRVADMCRTIAMLCVPALLVCAACTETQNSEDVSHVSISVERMIAEDASTKATIVVENVPQFYWQDTDEVGIFPDKGGYQLGFSLEGQGGKKTGTFDGGGWAMRSDAKYSTYYPFNFENRSSSRIPVSYLGQKQTGDNNMNHIGNYWFCAATPTASENGRLDFFLKNIGCFVMFKITLPDAGTFTEISLVTDDVLFTAEGFYNLKTLTPEKFQNADFNALTPTKMSSRMTLELEGVTTTAAGQTITAYMMAAPFNVTDHRYKLYVKSAEGLYYSADLSAKNHRLNRNESRGITVTVKSSDGYNIGINDWGTNGSVSGNAE